MAVSSWQPLLTFWFGDLRDGFADDAHRQRWFDGSAEVDDALRAAFPELPQRAAAGELDHWLDDPEGLVCFVLACDQLPRNLYRGSERAFATDALALAVARRAVDDRIDLGLGYDARAFLYLPFEHSEAPSDQHASVGLFSRLRDDTPPGRRHLTGAYLKYAQQHRDIVLRFGRFPHRNALLGRPSSAAELEYLKSATTFGQGAGSADH
ncbi:MAG: DUF924 family protein [Pseudomonadales bacterium]